MIISKKATRLMTFILAFAFMMTGLAYVPIQVQAEEKHPTVKVLGATLRLDNKSGTQSLRLGIEISNASLAKDCGIVIGANSKEVTVGTDVEEGTGKKSHTEMYSIDKEKDKVVYSAVVTGIPVASFGQKFSVKGYVTALKATDKTETEGVEKSVDGVVEALKEKNPNIDLDKTTGELVRRTEDGTTEKLTKEDMDSVFRMPNISLDLTKSDSYVIDGNSTTAEYNKSTNMLDINIGQFQGIIFKNPAENADDYKYVTVTYTSDYSLNTYTFNSKMTDGKGQTPAGQEECKDDQLSQQDNPAVKTYENPSKAAMYGAKFVHTNWNYKDNINLSIKSVVFSHDAPVEFIPKAPPYYKVDFKNDTKLEDTFCATHEVLEDDTDKVKFSELTGIYYILPDTPEMRKSDYKHVAITYENEGGGVEVYLPTEKMDLADPLVVLGDQKKKEAQTEKLTGTGIKRYSSSLALGGINLFSSWGNSATMNIKSIIFSERELTDSEIAEITGDSSPVTTKYDTPVGFMDMNESVAGAVEDIKYDSTVITKEKVVERKAKVVLPKGYSAAKKYPVVYMLHGIGENETTMYERKTQYLFWNAAASGAAKDMIVVFPNICANETGKPPVDEEGNEKFFSLEHYAAYDNFVNDLEQCLMPYINEHYSTLTDRKNTAVCGFSMGGREALYIGTTKAKYFGYVGGFCPTYGLFAYPPNWTGVGEDGLFSSKADFKPADGYADDTLILIVKGVNDGTVGDQPYLYHSVLEENNVPHLYYETLGGDPENVGDGGHDASVYTHGLYNLIIRMSASE